MTYPPEHRRCTATSKQKGVRCGHWRVDGRSVCRYHGGLAGRPKGRYRKGLERLKEMREHYDGALRATDFADLRPGIAMLDVRADELIARFEGAKTPEERDALWDKLEPVIEKRARRTESAIATQAKYEAIQRETATNVLEVVMRTIEEEDSAVAARILDRIDRKLGFDRTSPDLPRLVEAE